jgi:ring-1,2-phenylacetyl-CoA epoxidase subunit PaaE
MAAAALADPDVELVTVVDCNRSQRDVMFLDELADLKDRYPARFRLVHVLSREPHEVELFYGRLDPEKLAELTSALLPVDGVDEWFLCGPFEMVEGARELLAARGVPANRVHTELFHVEGTAPRESTAVDDVPAEGSSTVTVTLDGRASTLQVARSGEKVLDAVLTVRRDAPYACKGGVCGTCRAKLLDGRVEMERNFALEDDEVDAGYVLTCQSHPSTPKVSLDYDA